MSLPRAKSTIEPDAHPVEDGELETPDSLRSLIQNQIDHIRFDIDVAETKRDHIDQKESRALLEYQRELANQSPTTRARTDARPKKVSKESPRMTAWKPTERSFLTREIDAMRVAIEGLECAQEETNRVEDGELKPHIDIFNHVGVGIGIGGVQMWIRTAKIRANLLREEIEVDKAKYTKIEQEEIRVHDEREMAIANMSPESRARLYVRNAKRCRSIPRLVMRPGPTELDRLSMDINAKSAVLEGIEQSRKQANLMEQILAGPGTIEEKIEALNALDELD